MSSLKSYPCLHYPRNIAITETKNRRDHSLIDIDACMNINKELTTKITKSAFDVSGAFPYLFDALSYICTHHKDKIKRFEDSEETHYRVEVPFNFFIFFALDGKNEYKKSLMTEIYSLALKPLGKVISLDKTRSILTIPIFLQLVYDDVSNGDQAKIKRLVPFGNKLPISKIIIDFYKPLFSDLFSGDYGEKWIPIPKSFHVKLLESIDICKTSSNFVTSNHVATPVCYRKLFMFMNLHDNGKGKNLFLKSKEVLLACYPSLLDDIDGSRYIRYTATEEFLTNAETLFKKMSENGLLEGAKIFPQKISINRTTEVISVGLKRP